MAQAYSTSLLIKNQYDPRIHTKQPRTLSSAQLISRDFMDRSMVLMMPHEFFSSQKDYRSTRAVPPFITFSTSLSVAIVVSPGVVIASAPCAAPQSTAHCGPLLLSKP